MDYQGVLRKMNTEIGNPIEYFLTLGDDELCVNELIENHLDIHLEGYECLNCGKAKKIYRQGYCYNCFYQQPSVGDWIMRPELSTAHLDIEDRDLEYEKKVQLTPHIVYLALSSEVKVGVTRKTQVPTRWIDQGANEALAIVETPNRYLAGVTEVALKKHFADKTNWRKMLTNTISSASLSAVRDKIEPLLPDEAKPYLLKKGNAQLLEYPVLKYPEKVKSLNLTKTPDFSGKLIGIKGQYLIFEDNTVFNIRSNEGLVISLDV